MHNPAAAVLASSRALVSQAEAAKYFGYLSITSWLCAQLPQVIVNARRRSADGLALPFLLNWLFGDVTNLIGCLLTDQLPFQKWLAGYFCIIDMCLCVQYFYYNSQAASARLKVDASPYPVTASPHQSLVLPPQSPYQRHSRTLSSSTAPISRAQTAGPSVASNRPAYPRRPTRHRWSSSSLAHGQGLHPAQGPDVMVNSASPAEGPYAAMYQAAMDVAHAAERAEMFRAKSQSRVRGYSSRRTLAEETDGGDRALARMNSSYHSDMSAMSRSSTEGGGEGDAQRGHLSLSTHTLRDTRGRTLRRTAVATPPSENEAVGNLPATRFIDTLPDVGGPTEMRENRSKSRSLSIVRGASGAGKARGRKAAGVAFMSLALLLRFGPELRAGGGLPSSQGGYRGGGGMVLLSGVQSRTAGLPPSTMVFGPGGSDGPGYPAEPPDIQRMVGRISAWACTTLYLTSRLPQIWKNFQRRSVEGLSILLFLFAFIGNLTYVCSILLNPAGDANPADAGHYLLESLPYLLGSGGTLLFDLTIMLQSLIYGSAPPVPQPADHSHLPSSRRRLFRRRTDHAEDGFPRHSERSPLLSSGTHLAASQMTEDGLPPMVASAHMYRSGTSGSQPDTGARPRSKSPGAALKMSQGSRSPGRTQGRDLSMEAVTQRNPKLTEANNT